MDDDDDDDEGMSLRSAHRTHSHKNDYFKLKLFSFHFKNVKLRDRFS